MNENELISCMIEVYVFTQFKKSVFCMAFSNLLIDPSHELMRQNDMLLYHEYELFNEIMHN